MFGSYRLDGKRQASSGVWKSRIESYRMVVTLPPNFLGHSDLLCGILFS